jgi:hypothetical protein
MQRLTRVKRYDEPGHGPAAGGSGNDGFERSRSMSEPPAQLRVRLGPRGETAPAAIRRGCQSDQARARRAAGQGRSKRRATVLSRTMGHVGQGLDFPPAAGRRHGGQADRLTAKDSRRATGTAEPFSGRRGQSGSQEGLSERRRATPWSPPPLAGERVRVRGKARESMLRKSSPTRLSRFPPPHHPTCFPQGIEMGEQGRAGSTARLPSMQRHVR